MSTTIAEVVNSPESLILDLHKKYLVEAGPAAPFLELNRAAINRFEYLRFPHAKHEMFSFVNTKDLARTRFQLRGRESAGKGFVRDHIYAGCEKSVLVVVDGVYRPDLSDLSAPNSRVKTLSLQEAVSNFAIKQYLLDTIRSEDDVFAAVNGAFFNQGVFVEVEPTAFVDAPLQILHVSTGSPAAPVMTTPRVLVKVGRHAEIKIVVKYVGAAGNYFVNAAQDFILEENCKVVCAQVQADPFDAWHFSKDRVQMSRHSRFDAVNAFSGCKLARRYYEVHLKESGAEMTLNGVSVLADREQAHNLVRVHHEAPQCSSNLRFKNIVGGNARSSVDGTIVVNKGAQLTNSDQLINNLMLSDDAHADSKPNLMIYADDVKCTHGSTVGQLDEEQLFYLNTRCLSPKIAKTLLTSSFAESVIGVIPFPAVARGLRETLLKKLEANHA